MHVEAEEGAVMLIGVVLATLSKKPEVICVFPAELLHPPAISIVYNIP